MYTNPHLNIDAESTPVELKFPELLLIEKAPFRNIAYSAPGQ